MLTHALFRAAMAGQHAIQGFRNTHLTRRLYRRPPTDQDEAHRRCERVSRLIVKLHGHGLVAKNPHAESATTESPATADRVMTAAITLHDDRFADDSTRGLTESRTCLLRGTARGTPRITARPATRPVGAVWRRKRSSRDRESLATSR